MRGQISTYSIRLELFCKQNHTKNHTYTNPTEQYSARTQLCPSLTHFENTNPPVWEKCTMTHWNSFQKCKVVSVFEVQSLQFLVSIDYQENLYDYIIWFGPKMVFLIKTLNKGGREGNFLNLITKLPQSMGNILNHGGPSP